MKINFEYKSPVKVDDLCSFSLSYFLHVPIEFVQLENFADVLNSLKILLISFFFRWIDRPGKIDTISVPGIRF